MLTLLSTLIFSGCSNKPEVKPVIETVYEKLYIPKEVLIIKCVTRSEVSTPRLLAAAWKSEKKCREAYQKLIDGLIETYTKEGVSPNVNTTNK